MKLELKKLELENELSKKKIDLLTLALEKYSQFFNVLIGRQRVNFSKNGLDYKDFKKEKKTYFSIIAREQVKIKSIVKTWMPKQYLVDPVGRILF